MKQVAALLVACLLTACVTGDQVRSLNLGMTRDQVMAAMGAPDGARRDGRSEALTYSNRLMSGWSWDRADYHVILTDDRVVSYGPGVVRQNAAPGATPILVIVPR